MHHRSLKIAAFTSVELIIAMAITLVVLGAVYNFYVSQTKSFSRQQDLIAVQQDVRIAIEQLVTQLQTAGYDPRGTVASLKAGSVPRGRPGSRRDSRCWTFSVGHSHISLTRSERRRGATTGCSLQE